MIQKKYDTLIGTTFSVGDKFLRDLIREFQSANVYPISVDKIDEVFFSKRDFGQNLIVETTNSLNHDFKQYPTFIGTTNSKEYVVEERATSRTYYIKVDNPFDCTKSQQSKRTFNRIVSQTDTKLFKDFMSRYYQLILDKPDEVVGYNEEGYFYFLLGARQIFKDYYEIVGVDVPDYFPVTRYDDFSYEQRREWKHLIIYNYDDSNIFKYRKDTDEIVFMKNHLNQSDKSYERSTSAYYLSLLPANRYDQGQSWSSYNIVIYADAFFDWLELDNLYEERSDLQAIQTEAEPEKVKESAGLFGG